MFLSEKVVGNAMFGIWFMTSFSSNQCYDLQTQTHSSNNANWYFNLLCISTSYVRTLFCLSSYRQYVLLPLISLQLVPLSMALLFAAFCFVLWNLVQRRWMTRHTTSSLSHCLLYPHPTPQTQKDTDSQPARQAGRQPDRQTDRQTDRHHTPLHNPTTPTPCGCWYVLSVWTVHDEIQLTPDKNPQNCKHSLSWIVCDNDVKKIWWLQG